MLKDALIGLWSIDVMYGPGAQEDTTLAFLPDGTGWLAFEHYFLCELDTFKWDIDDDQYLNIKGIDYFGLKEIGRVVIKMPSSLSFSKLKVSVNEESVPNGEIMRVATFDAPIWARESKFAFVTKDPIKLTPPKFSVEAM